MKTRAAKSHRGPKTGSEPRDRAGSKRRKASGGADVLGTQGRAPSTFTPKPAPVVVPPGIPREKQEQYYDEAVRLFQAQRFDHAAALFQKVLEGPDRTLAHRAQVHSQICQQRITPLEINLKTAEDHYNYAVTMMNARRLKEAAQHLEKALEMAPQADHVHYALAAANALLGNAEAAYERLKTAIELQPRNRYLARGDSDFAGMLEYAPMASLLQIDRGGFSKPQ